MQVIALNRKTCHFLFLILRRFHLTLIYPLKQKPQTLVMRPTLIDIETKTQPYYGSTNESKHLP